MNQMGSRFLMCITTQGVTRPLDKDEIDTIHFLIKHVHPNKTLCVRIWSQFILSG